jgi:putative ABC transport system substrate-binding protein
MNRREFITLLGGAAAWPAVARAQQTDRLRRIGVLMPLAADDPVGQARIVALREGLEKLGWIEGRNIRIDTRWTTTSDVESMQRFAKELVALQPDRPDFHRQGGFARRFARKGREIALGLRRMG